MPYLPKAELMFRQKLKTALAPTGYIYVIGDGLDYQAPPEDMEPDLFEGEMIVRNWSAGFDFNYVAELFQQYLGYLLLCEDDNALRDEVDA